MSSISGIGRDVGALRDEAQRRLRDVDRVIADALEVARHLDRGDDEAKVARHRLLQGEQLERGGLDLELHRIELAVGIDHRVGLAGVLTEQRLHRELDERFRLLRHREETTVERRELIVKMAKWCFWAHPNLPVMYASVRSSRGLVKSRCVSPISISLPR